MRCQYAKSLYHMFNLVRSKIHELGFASNIFNFLGKPLVSDLNKSFCIIFLNIYHHAAKENNKIWIEKMDEKNNLVQQEKRTLFSPFKRFLAEGIGHNCSISQLKQF